MSDPTPPAPPPAPPPEQLLPEMATVTALFERGDFRGTRQALQAIFAGNPTPEVAAAAHQLQARLRIDPWGFRMGLLALALLALVTGIYVF